MVVKSDYDVVIPENTIWGFLYPRMKAFGDETAIIDTSSGKHYSYADVIRISKNIAKSLHCQGIEKGDVLIFCCPNNAESLFVTLGTTLLGGIVVGLSSQFTPDELLHHFTDSKVRYIVTVPTALENVVTAIKRLPHDQIRKIYVVGQKTNSTYRKAMIETFEGLLSPPENASIPIIKIQPRIDPGLMLYSSGTTGLPKGVVLSHYNVIHTLETSFNQTVFNYPTRGSATLMCLPLQHATGIGCSILSLRNGAKLILMPKFDANGFLKLIQKHKVSFIIMVPPMLLFLAKHPIVSQYDLTSLNTILVGAAPIGKEVMEQLLRRHPNVKHLYQGYGMTEVGLTHISRTLSIDNLASCGALVANCECKIIDESGNELGEMQNGEICVRTKSVMLRYFNNPRATCETIDNEGWLHTGDIGRYDSDGNFYIAGRLKELIKVKGFQVAPAELEDILLKHDSIVDCAVIGIPDEYAGELPRLYTVVDSNRPISKLDIYEYLKKKVTSYKLPHGGIVFINSIPKSPSGKILRRELQKLYSEDMKSKL